MEIKSYHTDSNVGSLRLGKIVKIGLCLACKLVYFKRTYYAPYVVSVRFFRRLRIDLVESLPEDYDIVNLNGEDYYKVDDTVYKVSISEGKPYFEVLGQLYV